MDESRTDDDLNALRRSLLALLPGLALADTANAQDAAKMQPQAYRVALDNDKLRVLEYRSKPGMGVCGEGMHSHPAHLTVVMTAGKVRGKTPDGKVIVAESKVGDVFWSEAETHEVENISGRNFHALLIELKPGAGKS
jgi:ATP-dependent phosphoenolpyruvate carboxykinase